MNPKEAATNKAELNEWEFDDVLAIPDSPLLSFAMPSTIKEIKKDPDCKFITYKAFENARKPVLKCRPAFSNTWGTIMDALRV